MSAWVLFASAVAIIVCVCVCLWTTIYYIGVNGRPVRADAPVSDQRATNRLRFYV